MKLCWAWLAALTLLVQAVAGAGGDEGRAPQAVPFRLEADAMLGRWETEGTASPGVWRPGDHVAVTAKLRLTDRHLDAFAAERAARATDAVMLVTAERTFDADGWLRLPIDERMSTLVTPAGIAIEGGVPGAVTKRFGYTWSTPLDLMASRPLADSPGAGGIRQIAFALEGDLPKDLPPGIYRLRIDYGLAAGKRLASLAGGSFAQRPSSKDRDSVSYFYTGTIPAFGTTTGGRSVDPLRLSRRIPWVLLAQYNSNGYRGAVAEEDRGRFALSDRNIIPDEVILPRYGSSGERLAYSLEPQFPADGIDPRCNIPWNWERGELTVSITGPDGRKVDLGTAAFKGRKALGPTTGSPAFAAWKPPAYGRYTVRATGWIEDLAGNRYEGGGTYRFWIAKRMTMATATFQGQPYPVGGRYGRDIAFFPALPADVTVKVDLYPDSDPAKLRTLTYTGRASAAGLFGAAQGAKPFPLDAPGEYHAQITATAVDGDGALWVCSMRHAGVVFPEPSPIVAHGKKLVVGKQLLDRGETHTEGALDAAGEGTLAHINFPYNAGDAILIASEQQGANKIEPVLTWSTAGAEEPYDPKLSTIGASNARIRTSSGYSPHLYPEHITSMEYYYGSAPRPGFMSRFLVGEDGVRAPYWPTSRTNFGGQIGASGNGDLPGDIYRLLGGVVVRRPGEAPRYAGYMASAFILPKGTNNNRVIAAGGEDLIGPDGKRARFFLVGLRPGSTFDVGASLRAALQIDPILPARVRVELEYPDGRVKAAEGVGDRTGSFAGADAWVMDAPGVYRLRVKGDWEGHPGLMPGLPAGGGFVYVANGGRGPDIDLAPEAWFDPVKGLRITGSSTAGKVAYAVLMPGAVLDQGEVAVKDGRWEYFFDAKTVSAAFPIYDTADLVSGKPQIGRVVHLTFFSGERGPDGKPLYGARRVILRGNRAITAD